MYGYKLRTWIYRRAILAVTFFLTWFTVASWSQNAFGKYHDLLNLGLILIGVHFLETALKHPKRLKQVFKWLNTSIKFEHLCLFGAFSFFAIAIFPLESRLFSNYFHYVATGLGVSSIGLLASGWHKTWSWQWWSFNIAIIIGVLLLVSAFLPFLKNEVPWQVGHGEFWLMMVGLVYFETIKDK